MSKRPPTRYSAQKEHDAYGIKNWYRQRKIMDEDARKAIEYAFCEANGFDMGCIKDHAKRNKFICNRFVSFGDFAIKYCIDNNYKYE